LKARGGKAIERRAGILERKKEDHVMKPLAIACLLAALVSPVGVSADPGDKETPPQILGSGTLVCVTPEIYQEMADAQDKSVRAEMLEANKCMSVTEDAVEEMLAPFVVVLEQRGDLVLVQYSVEYEEKLELLHRKVAHVRFTGWTDSANLLNYYEWLTGKPQT
jgi:hypothetical protein